MARLPGTVWRLGWISFFADVSSEMAYPVLPLFMKAIGAPAAALGVVEGFADATANVLKGYAGVKSDASPDRVGFVRWGYGLSAIGKPLIALATAWPTVLGARMLDRTGKGLRTAARDSLLAESAPKERLGAAFGLHRSMDTAGAFVGVLFALVLLHYLPGAYRSIFLIALLPGLISVGLTMFVRDPRGAPAAQKAIGAIRALPRSLWPVILLQGLFALANTSDMFLLRFAADRGLSDTQVTLAYLLMNLSYAVLSYPAGHVSDRLGRWPIIGLGWLIYAGVYAALPGASVAMIWPLFFVYGLYVALTQGVAKALISERAGPDQKGAALGVWSMAVGLFSLVGNILFGLLWDVKGANAALYAAAGVALVSALLIPLVRRPIAPTTTN